MKKSMAGGPSYGPRTKTDTGDRGRRPVGKGKRKGKKKRRRDDLFFGKKKEVREEPEKGPDYLDYS